MRAAPRRVTVLGLGLIGTSLAAALGRAGVLCRGWDPDRSAMRIARRMAGVAPVPGGPGPAAEGAETVVLAAPPGANLDLMRELRGLDPGVTVTDVGSVKREPARVGKRILGDRFVPGHPLAGRERSGAAHADPDLFRGRPWAVCGGAPRHRRRVERLVEAAGGRPVRLGPAEHDREVALVSHLPQLLASLLLAEAGGRRPESLALAGSGFEGWARLAASPPELWKEILDGNAVPVRRELARLERALAGLRSRWERDENAALRCLREGRRGYERLERMRSRGRGPGR